MIALLFFYIVAYSAGAMLMLALLMALDLLRRKTRRKRAKHLPTSHLHHAKAPATGPLCWWGPPGQKGITTFAA